MLIDPAVMVPPNTSVVPVLLNWPVTLSAPPVCTSLVAFRLLFVITSGLESAEGRVDAAAVATVGHEVNY